MMQKAFTISILFILFASLSIDFVCGFSSPPVFASSLVNLPLNDSISDFNEEAYDFVHRFLCKRFVKGFPRGILPLSRGEISAILLELEKKQEKGEISLSKTDKGRLEALLAYFSDELQELGERSNKRRHVMFLKGEQYQFSADFSLLQESLTRTGKSFSLEGREYITSILPDIHGQVRHDFAFASSMAYRFLYGDFFADIFRDESSWTQFEGKLQNTTTVDAYLLFKLPWFSLQLGKDNLRWGPGYHGALLVSENPLSWDMIKLLASYKNIKFNAFTAILRDENEDINQKYLSGHRIEGFFWNRIGIGLSEVIVYGNRFEPSYLNPLSIYLITEMNITKADSRAKGGDNILISGDMRIRLDNVELYGELMVDDADPSRDFHYWDNKFGILGGVYLTDLLVFRDTDLKIEYAFINQYAYTHEAPVNPYTHFSSVIGHQIGPDADDLWVQLKHRFTDKLEFALTYELERHGEGNITKGTPEKSSQWTPLSGVTQSEHSLSLGCSYTHIGRYRLGIAYKRNWMKNLVHQHGKKASGQEITVEGVYRF